MTPTQAALLEALTAAAKSLRTIATLAGRDDLMADVADVRAYADSRARVAEDAALRAAEAAQPEPFCWANPVIALPDDEDEAHGWTARVSKTRDAVFSMPLYAAPPQAAPIRSLVRVSSIDVERMLAECVPGGSSCDPQQVADAIRSYCNAWEQPAPIAAQADILAALMTCRAALRVLSEATDRDVRPGIWTMAGGWDALDKADHVMTMVKNHPPQLRPNTPSDARALAAIMQAAAGDPMWANHAEVNKATLQRAANALLFMAGQVEHLAACVDPAAFEEARPETAAESVQRMAQEARDAADANWCAQQRSKEQ